MKIFYLEHFWVFTDGNRKELMLVKWMQNVFIKFIKLCYCLKWNSSYDHWRVYDSNWLKKSTNEHAVIFGATNTYHFLNTKKNPKFELLYFYNTRKKIREKNEALHVGKNIKRPKQNPKYREKNSTLIRSK